MPRPWIVVAHNEAASIYSVERPTGPLEQIATFEHPESALRNRDLKTDRPGRAVESAGAGRHAMSSEVDPVTEEALKFARQLADELRAGRVAKRYDTLYLVAAPAFLGLLREALDDDTRARVLFELDKNVAREDAPAIRRRLPKRLS
ncbi:MAG: host attachment protein [Gammaproteobacteria bacterium]